MSFDAYSLTLDAGLPPDIRRRAAIDTVRRVLLEAEEVYLAGPEVTLGTWLVRVQETVSLAANVTLTASEEELDLADESVVVDEIAVFAELCAEAIRAAARVRAEDERSDDTKEAILGFIGCEETPFPSQMGWPDLHRILMRCQAALEPLANELREGDLPMARESDVGGLASDTLTEIARHAYGAVLGLCGSGEPGNQARHASAAPDEGASGSVSVGTAGASVRRSAKRHYGKAAREFVWAAVVLLLAVAVAAKGTWFSATLLAFGGAMLAVRCRRFRSSGRTYTLGAVSEERVGRVLDQLGPLWVVEHDVEKPGGGNIDHVVHSPAAIYAVDTKRSRCRDKDLGQAHRHAIWAAGHYGGSKPIVPVVCIERSDDPAVSTNGVWIVGAGRLRDLLLRSGEV